MPHKLTNSKASWQAIKMAEEVAWQRWQATEVAYDEAWQLCQRKKTQAEEACRAWKVTRKALRAFLFPDEG